MRNEWSGPIWPTKHEPMWCQPGGGCPTCARNRMDTHLQRTRGIAEGHAKERARRERFARWLEQATYFSAAKVARLHRSPEAAVLAAANRGAGWPFHAVGGRWPKRWAQCYLTNSEVSLAKRLLASASWAALPWQREGSDA